MRSKQGSTSHVPASVCHPLPTKQAQAQPHRWVAWVITVHSRMAPLLSLQRPNMETTVWKPFQIAEAWGMKSRKGTDCNLSGHYTHYVPTASRPTTSNTEPQEGKHLRITHLYLGFGFVLEITLQGAALVFASTLCCQVLEIGRQPGPWARGQPSSSCSTEVKAGWQST